MSEELEVLKQKRIKWVEANRENGFDEGINRLLTELYPDNAHFIYELLQNAEDPQATTVQFKLTDSSVEFSHDGNRLFSFKDVESITSIGNSTKRDDATSIGKFGVGFKAVFAYTNTPEIHSGDFHFRIRDLVLPETNGVEQFQIVLKQTRFIFPFDNPKKSAATAAQEIEKGLCALGDNTLLFLSHIRKIDYTLPDGSVGSLKRMDHSNGHIEIQITHPHNEATESYWLHFEKTVEVNDDGKPKRCRIAIAYQLERETGKNKDQSVWKIIPVEGDGQVSIYFPAEKETSKLRFHIHAPFASTVARDSVRDCLENNQLRDYLAELIVESFIAIRDQGLLTMSFLAVLPNERDNLAKFYEPIRQTIVAAFKNQLLTPTKSGTHAKSEALYRGPSRISEVICDEDLSLLTDYEVPLWVANPPQLHQREDNFLDSLAIDTWEVEQLSAIFKEVNKEKISQWLLTKDDGWMLRFYSLLNEAKETHEKAQDRLASRDKKEWPGLLFPLVRVDFAEGVKHVCANEAYFAPEEANIIPPTDISIVKHEVYSKDKVDNEIIEPAKKFLQRIGVKTFTAKAAIEIRLKRYPFPSGVSDDHYEDIKQFIIYLKKSPEDSSIFHDYSFLFGTLNDKLYWKKAAELCFDEPFFETDLSELTDIHQKHLLWQGYIEKFTENELKQFIEFVKAVGVMYELEIVELEESKARNNHIYRNNRWYIKSFKDYSILELEKYLNCKKIAASKLVWNALIKAPKEYSNAFFEPKNPQKSKLSGDSQLIYHLKNNAWIPSISGEFLKPQEMTQNDLLDDFPFNITNGLLTKIGFGENARNEIYRQQQEANKQNQEYQDKQKIAQDNGFGSHEEMVTAAALVQEAKKQGISLVDLQAELTKNTVEKPQESVPNPERRRKGVLERSENAPPKESVSRERSIQPGINSITAEAKAYLRAKYKNSSNELICQCCHKEMPFKISDDYYFEAVQCIRTLNKQHFENRLALCPLCSAKYQYARETKDSDIIDYLLQSDRLENIPSIEVPVVLAGKAYQLHFVGTHWFDLKIKIKTEISS